MKYDAVVVGGGPGGLTCAALLADQGVKVLVLERKSRIGPKVCAGGITKGGLINALPQSLIQRAFSSQTIITKYQHLVIDATGPMIGTVNRRELGTHMAGEAAASGAEIITGARADTVSDDRVIYILGDRSYEAYYDFLVGADGSSSKVRKFLGIDSSAPHCGVGLHYVVGDAGDKMVWNFNADSFGSGYSWIFPHRDYASVGAYLADGSISPLQLKKNLDRWLGDWDINPADGRFEADKINIDYRGWAFGSRFLIGDAAGFASPLTGEGINPALVSAEAVAAAIITPSAGPDNLQRIIRRHRSHRMMSRTAGRSRLLALVLSELSGLLLRFGIIGFDKFEMA